MASPWHENANWAERLEFGPPPGLEDDNKQLPRRAHPVAPVVEAQKTQNTEEESQHLPDAAQPLAPMVDAKAQKESQEQCKQFPDSKKNPKPLNP